VNLKFKSVELMTSRLIGTVSLFLIAIQIIFGAPAPASRIAWVGTTIAQTSVFDNKSLEGDPVREIGSGTKVVVLSKTTDVCRVLLETGDEVFCLAVWIAIGDEVTLAGAMSKVRFFERKSAEEPWNLPYFDTQSAPWVALVARELARSPGGKLPEPEEIEQQEDSLPQLEVKNLTQYTLRIYLAGPRTFSRLVQPGGAWKDDLPTGSYRVVAEVTSGNVTPLRTTWHLKRRYVHTVRLYIKTTRVPGR